MLIFHRAIRGREVTHWGSVFSSPSAGSCTSSNPPSNQETLVPLEKHDHPAACPSHRVEEQDPAPLAMAFITHEIPQQPGQPEKALDHVTVWKSLGRQQEITHTLAEVDFITKQAIWTAWLMMANQASGKGVHVSLTGRSSHGGRRPGYTHRGRAFPERLTKHLPNFTGD